MKAFDMTVPARLGRPLRDGMFREDAGDALPPMPSLRNEAFTSLTSLTTSFE
jgi:hypothetical protein